MQKDQNRYVSLGEDVNLYRKDMHHGGWFSFNAKKSGSSAEDSSCERIFSPSRLEYS